ncbi:hypothetical protein FK529_11405 [Tsukamurella asaccharolytica]|uniref:DUF5652 domain-containing protein n=1 Tax=Tsukamurella asaccharolytica TaxID=2592067 RepID=A0A5C5R8T8_9ACTN|nr:hypothetical protein [Tsukamurella asaccharolytica]TWS19116.1 hypothetical protein FK529_11405 [Tsukamurella asaccharolytica]
MSPKKKISWNDLSPRAKTAIVATSAVDAGLRAWALADLAGRDAAEVRGPKKLWALGLGVANSAGVLPAAYLLFGRGPRMA